MEKRILTIMLLFLSFIVSGQGLSEDKRKEFEAQKVSFFTSFMDLTPEEAAVFWPLYNEMFKKKREYEEEMRKAMQEYFRLEKKSGGEAKNMLDRKLEIEQKLLDLKKEYYQKLADVMSVDKVLKIDWAEHTFNKQLLNKMRGCPRGPEPGH